MALIPTASKAQSSSINTFSPYSMYGLGDLANIGTTDMRAMGGTGVAYRDTGLNPYFHSVNLLNPASYSAVPQKSFIFSIGLQGENYYMKQGSKKTSYNSFNVKDVAFLFPVAKKVGVSLSLTPFSSVGYRMEERLSGALVESNFVDVRKKYSGEGDFTQIKLGVGAELFKGFSVGADMIYLMGNTDRNFNVDITPLPGSGNYYSSMATQSEHISRIFGLFGAQYNIVQTNKKVITLGATYQMGGKLNPEIKRIVPADIYNSEIISETVYHDDNLKMADIMSVGGYYHTAKMSFGVDYVYQDWGSKNKTIDTGTSFRNTNTIKAGFEYTPNAFDIRKFFNRLTYRVGVRYGDNYTRIKGHDITDKAITFGFAIPTRWRTVSHSKLDFGFEIGQRGSSGNGLIKENYYKFSIGLKMFGEDYWFMKRKYK